MTMKPAGGGKGDGEVQGHGLGKNQRYLVPNYLS
jgi:hypothetical protein